VKRRHEFGLLAISLWSLSIGLAASILTAPEAKAQISVEASTSINDIDNPPFTGNGTTTPVTCSGMLSCATAPETTSGLTTSGSASATVGFDVQSISTKLHVITPFQQLSFSANAAPAAPNAPFLPSVGASASAQFEGTFSAGDLIESNLIAKTGLLNGNLVFNDPFMLSNVVGTQLGIQFLVVASSATNPALSVGATASLLCNPSGCTEASGTGNLITSTTGVNDIEFVLNLASLPAGSLILDESVNIGANVGICSSGSGATCSMADSLDFDDPISLTFMPSSGPVGSVSV
jgi:hypothetical protein